MPPVPIDDAIARRDALLAELDSYHERLMIAAQADEPEAIDALLIDRQAIIDALAEVVDRAPIPADVGVTLARREAELEAILKSEMDRTNTTMGTAARKGKAAMRYRRGHCRDQLLGRDDVGLFGQDDIDAPVLGAMLR